MQARVVDIGFQAKVDHVRCCVLSDHNSVDTHPLPFHSTAGPLMISKFLQQGNLILKSRPKINLEILKMTVAEGKNYHKCLFQKSETWVLRFLPVILAGILVWETLC